MVCKKRGIFDGIANNQLRANHKLVHTKANKFCLSVKCWLYIVYYARLTGHINNSGFVFHQHIQTHRNNKSTRPVASCFHQFLGVWIPWWNTRPRCGDWIRGEYDVVSCFWAPTKASFFVLVVMSLNNLLVSNVKRKLHRRESSESSSNSAVEKRLKELSPLVAWMNKCAALRTGNWTQA